MKIDPNIKIDIKVSFSFSKSKHFKNAINIIMDLPNYQMLTIDGTTYYHCNITNIFDLFSYKNKLHDLIFYIQKWKSSTIEILGKHCSTIQLIAYESELCEALGDYSILLSSNSVTYEKYLPLPIVYYPNIYGAFFLLSEDINSQKYFCECEKKPIINYLILREKSPKQYSGLTGAPFSISLFPETAALKSSINPENPLSLFKFKPKLCHKCNNVVPRLNFCQEMYGSKFQQKHGWFIKQKYFEMGINPNDTSDTLDNICIPDLVDINTYVTNLCQKDFGYPTSKWKSEGQLFHIIEQIYPNEIILRNYRSDWLNGLELDIFIPNKKIAFKYQGIQHYEAVDFFGGSEQLLIQQKHDKDKLQICKDKKIKLVLIDYDEELTKEHILSKIKFTY